MNDENIMTDVIPVSPTLKITKDMDKIKKYLENAKTIERTPVICRAVINSGTIDEMIAQQEALLSTVRR